MRCDDALAVVIIFLLLLVVVFEGGRAAEAEGRHYARQGGAIQQDIDNREETTPMTKR